MEVMIDDYSTSPDSGLENAVPHSKQKEAHNWQMAMFFSLLQVGDALKVTSPRSTI